MAASCVLFGIVALKRRQRYLQLKLRIGVLPFGIRCRRHRASMVTWLADGSWLVERRCRRLLLYLQYLVQILLRLFATAAFY